VGLQNELGIAERHTVNLRLLNVQAVVHHNTRTVGRVGRILVVVAREQPDRPLELLLQVLLVVVFRQPQPTLDRL
jgi:hypothetical protein